MTTKLRPPAERPPSRLAAADPTRLDGPAVPLRPVLLVGLAVLVVIAALRPGPAAAIIGVPLALLLPGTIVQRRFFSAADHSESHPRATSDLVPVWALRLAISFGSWVVIGAGVALGDVPVFSGWTAGAGAVLAAAVLLGDPDGGARWGTVSVRSAVTGVVALAVAAAVVFVGRGFADIAGSARDAVVGSGMSVGFADPSVPVALSPTGAQASVTLVVANHGPGAIRPTLTVQVGAGLAWTSNTVQVAPGRQATITLRGNVLVCRDSQQLGIRTESSATPVLTAVVPGALGATACPTS